MKITIKLLYKLTFKNWYFVSKIVLTYYGKKLGSRNLQKKLENNIKIIKMVALQLKYVKGVILSNMGNICTILKKIPDSSPLILH